jgi:HSP20 family protein
LDVLKGKVARELAALEERLDQVFERAFGSGVRLPGRTDHFRPAIDVCEKEGTLLVQVELAGVRPEDVRLVVDGEYLQISGQRRTLWDDPPRRHLQLEIPQGNFERVLRLRAPYDSDRVTASLEAGVLTVRLPLRARRSRTISVSSE